MEYAHTAQSGFVSLGEAIPELLTEIRYYTAYNFVGRRIRGYEAPLALATVQAAQALRAVSARLREKGYLLKVFDAYRPQRAVDHFVEWAADADDRLMQACFYPGVDKARLFQQGYIAARSGHSRGSTVDLTLFDMASGREADMGTPFDYLDPRSHPGAREGLRPEQIERRLLLRESMCAEGFRGIDTEWWHFQLAGEPYPETYFDFPVAPLK